MENETRQSKLNEQELEKVIGGVSAGQEQTTAQTISTQVAKKKSHMQGMPPPCNDPQF